MARTKLAIVGNVALLFAAYRVGSGSAESSAKSADSRGVAGGDRRTENAQGRLGEISWKSCLLEGLKESVC